MSLLTILSGMMKKRPTLIEGEEPPPPSSGFYGAQTGDITFTDSYFSASIPGYAKTGFTARSTGGFVDFRTSETEISVKIGGNWLLSNHQSDCEVLVDGVYNQSIRLTEINTIQSFPITLPPGEKIVTLVNGYTANTLSGSIILPNAGVYIQGVVTTGPIEVKVPATATNKWLFVGDSITTGASGTHPAVTGFPGLFRAEGLNYIQSDSWGARKLDTTTPTLANTMAAHLSSQMNGTISNELFLLLGTNNYGLSNQTKAAFKSYYGYLLDALISLRPDIIIYCISIMNRANYASGNTSGATGDDYADAVEECTSTRLSTKFIYGKNLVSLANLPDGIHPNQTGMQEIHDNLWTEYQLHN